MYRPHFILILLMCWAVASAQAEEAPANKGPVSLEDVLAMEGFGSVLIDPGGRRVVYERLRPYSQNTDYSFRSYAYAKSGHQLWTYDLESGDAPHLVPGLDPEPHTYLASFSPTGRYLAFFRYEFGQLRLGAYDFEEDRSVIFDAVPAIGRGGEYIPLWISEEDIVFTALPSGEWPSETSLRAQVHELLPAAWRTAWEGKLSTARAVQSRPRRVVDEAEPGRVLRANADSGQVEVIVSGKVSDIRRSPDGGSIAGFLETRFVLPAGRISNPSDGEGHLLVLLDQQTHQLKTLAPQIVFSPGSLVWHSSGQKLAAFGWKISEPSERGRFYRIDLKSGSAVPFDHKGLDIVSERERGWLHRPERALFFGDRLAVFARPSRSGPNSTGMFPHPGDQAHPEPGHWYALSDSGPAELISGDLTDVSAVPVHAADDHITLASSSGAYRYFTDGTQVRLTPPIEGRFRLHEDGSLAARKGLARPLFDGDAVFDVHSDTTRMVVLLDLSGGRKARSLTLPAARSQITLAGSFKSAVAIGEIRDEGAAGLIVRGTSNGQAASEIARVNAHMSARTEGDWRKVRYAIEAGGSSVELESCMLLPPGASPASPPPLIIEIYPGASADCTNPSWTPLNYPDPNSPYVWIQNGFAYSRLTLPQSLVADESGPLGGMIAMVEAGANAIVEQGYGDEERMVLHGYSLGGVSALYVAAHVPRFRAVIAKHSWADLFSHYFGGAGPHSILSDDLFGSFTRYELSRGSLFSMGATPFEAPAAYVANSPVFLAPQIEMPVLLIGSDLDTFDLGQFDEMYGALLRSGKDAVFVRYLGEGHGLSSPANIRDMWIRQLAFLEEREIAPLPASLLSDDIQPSPEPGFDRIDDK
jgi:dipeptidyl aminopeptidase/acylaminoacyl peptidase